MAQICMNFNMNAVVNAMVVKMKYFFACLILPIRTNSAHCASLWHWRAVFWRTTNQLNGAGSKEFPVDPTFHQMTLLSNEPGCTVPAATFF